MRVLKKAAHFFDKEQRAAACYRLMPEEKGKFAVSLMSHVLEK